MVATVPSVTIGWEGTHPTPLKLIGVCNPARKR